LKHDKIEGKTERQQRGGTRSPLRSAGAPRPRYIAKGITMGDTKSEIDINRIDMLVSAAKSFVGVVPYAGSLLSELVGNLIPNQRIDRLSKYLIELDKRLSQFEGEYIKAELKNEECVDLFEESFRQASRALSDDRRIYIASVIENGLSNEHISYLETKFLLQLLESLNDAEVIWLRYYLEPSLGPADTEFREKHQNILNPISATLGSDQDEIDKEAIQDSYAEHLERLGLIRPHYQMDSKTGIPRFDSFSGKPSVSYYDLTNLGQLLLRFIGLYEEI